jgi:PKD domain/RTX calcium-binding nonapeptide repeat (4 copies)/WD40-like Beta Propeller Repeat
MRMRERTSRRRGGLRLGAAMLGIALAVALAQIGPPASATFPGTNGLIAYISGGNIFLIDPASPVPQQITTGGGYLSVNFNASATRLVAANNAGVVFLDPTPGATVTQLTGGNANDRNPSFSPDGTRVTFDSGGDIFTQDVSGGGRTNLTTGIANTLSDPDWSPDGSFIAFQDNTDDQIKRINAAGGGLTTLTPAAAGCAAAADCEAPSVSPNSQNVAYDQDGAPQGILQVLSSGASAAALRLTTGNHDLPAYSPQGDRVAYQNAAGQLATAPTDGSGVETGLGVAVDDSVGWGVTPAPPAGPTAAFTATPTSGNAPLAVSFDGSASAPNATIVSYSWVFGDGQSGSGAQISHTYTAAGTFTATLTVTDNVGATGQSSQTITVTRGAGGGACTITGNARGNRLNGTPGPDVICGLGGADVINGRGGADVIRGGRGADVLRGNRGPDRLFGGRGADVLRGGLGADVANGGPGPDICTAETRISC